MLYFPKPPPSLFLKIIPPSHYLPGFQTHKSVSPHTGVCVILHQASSDPSHSTW